MNKTYVRGRIIKVAEIINAESDTPIRVLVTYNNGSYELYSSYGNYDFRYYRYSDQNGKLFKEIKEVELIKDNSSKNYKIKVTNTDKTSTIIDSLHPDEGWIDLSGNNNFKLMHEESLGSIRLGLSNVEVTNQLGEPTEKSEAVEWGADGLVHQTWYYRTTGVKLDMVGIGEVINVSSIDITAPCKLKTRRGIGIGSRRKDVIEVYKDEINKEGTMEMEKTPVIVAGSIYGGIIFRFENDTVSGIFIGAAAE